MRKPPCIKNGVPCTKRCPGCQDHCPEFADYRKGVDADAEKRAFEKTVAETYYQGKDRMTMERSLALGKIHSSCKMGPVGTRKKHCKVTRASKQK